MRIGIDVRALQNDSRYRGIGKFTQSWLPAFARLLAPGDEVVLYAEDGPLPDDLALALPVVRTVTVPRNRAAEIRFVRAFARPAVLIDPSPADVDVLLQPDPGGGFGTRVPAVVLLYDLIPLLFRGADPPGMSRTTLARHRVMQALAGWHYRTGLARYSQAAALVAISDATRDDYLRLLEPRPRREVRVGTGAVVALPPSPADGSAVLGRLGVGRAPYLLYVGGIDDRKNIVRLLHELRDLLPEHPDLRLVVVGSEFSRTAYLDALRWTEFLADNPVVADALVVAGYVDDDELAALYSHARAFVFPSRYEGFGLPVLEAMAAGCPVVCYRNSALTEVAGDAALMLDDGAPMAPAIERLLAEPALVDELRSRGRQQASRFTWDDAAAAVKAAVDEVVGAPSPPRRLARAQVLLRALAHRRPPLV